MSKTFSRCQDCGRMEYIVDGGCVCEPCLRLATSHKVTISHADQQIAALTARVTELEATIASCKAAGFIDEKGEVRRVLGSLPITADGAIAVYGASVFYFDGQDICEASCRGTLDVYIDWNFRITEKQGRWVLIKHCYSTREATQDAIKKMEEKQ